MTLQVSSAHQVQRVNRVALDVQDILEHLERRACPVFKGSEDHLEGQDYLASPDHQGVQVIKGCLG